MTMVTTLNSPLTPMKLIGEVSTDPISKMMVFFDGPGDPAKIGRMFTGSRPLRRDANWKLYVPMPRTRAAWRDFYCWASVCDNEGVDLVMEGFGS
jgi:hypothetical protein